MDSNFKINIVLNLYEQEEASCVSLIKSLLKKFKAEREEYYEELCPSIRNGINEFELPKNWEIMIKNFPQVSFKTISKLVFHWGGEEDPFAIQLWQDLGLLTALEKLQLLDIPFPNKEDIVLLPNLREIVINNNDFAGRTNQDFIDELIQAGFEKVEDHGAFSFCRLCRKR